MLRATRSYLIAAAALGSPLLAQPDPLSTAQLARGPAPVAAPSPAGSTLVLLSPQLGDNRLVPNVFGVLQLDARRLLVVPVAGDHGVADLLERFAHGAAPQRHLYYQVMTAGADGASLSPLQEIGDDPTLRFEQRDVEALCRRRAAQRIAESAGTEMAEGWQGTPRIVGVTPLFRPDVAGIAYYEYAIDQGGFVIVATGEHDRVIPNWTSFGPSKAAQLRAQAAAAGHEVARIYKLDALSYVAENRHGQKVGQLGNLPDQLAGLPAVLREDTPDPRVLDRRPWRSWRQMKQDYGLTYRPLLRQLRDNQADLWRVQREEERTAQVTDWSSWTTYTADGGTSAQPLYYQHTYGSCAVGGGPVAWAILFCWGDRQAHEGNPYWSGRTGLYRTNGGYSGASTKAPLYLDSGVQNVTEELHGRMGTWCISGSGATWPSRMKDADGYLSGRTSATCDSKGSDVGVNKSSYKEVARDSIKLRGTPAVIGTGFLSHYPVVYKYRYRTKKILWETIYDREFYVNNGWGSTSSFEWVEAGTFLYGVLYP